MTTDKSVPPAITPQQSIPRPEGPNGHGLTPTTPPPPPPDSSDEYDDDDTKVSAPKSGSGKSENKERPARSGATARKGRGRVPKKNDREAKTLVAAKPGLGEVAAKPSTEEKTSTSGVAASTDDEPTVVLDDAQRASGTSTVEVSTSASATAWDLPRGDSRPPAEPAQAAATEPLTAATEPIVSSAAPVATPVATLPATPPEAADAFPTHTAGPETHTTHASEGPAGSVSYKGAGVSGKATAELAQPAAEAGVPREIRLSIARFDPWSVLKLALILSFAVAIVIVVATAMFWYTLDGLQVFSKIDEFVTQIVGPDSTLDVLQYVAFSKVMSVAIVIAVVNIVLTTALATIGAMIYNVVARLVGGLHMTLMDD